MDTIWPKIDVAQDNMITTICKSQNGFFGHWKLMIFQIILKNELIFSRTVHLQVPRRTAQAGTHSLQPGLLASIKRQRTTHKHSHTVYSTKFDFFHLADNFTRSSWLGTWHAERFHRLAATRGPAGCCLLMQKPFRPFPRLLCVDVQTVVVVVPRFHRHRQ